VARSESFGADNLRRYGSTRTICERLRGLGDGAGHTFSARGRTMSFRSGRVDHLDVVGTEFDQGGEQPSPMA
jgi:hypothetical protein